MKATLNGVVIAQVDGGTAITYAVAYTSVGATAMQYTFSVVCEALA